MPKPKEQPKQITWDDLKNLVDEMCVQSGEQAIKEASVDWGLKIHRKQALISFSIYSYEEFVFKKQTRLDDWLWYMWNWEMQMLGRDSEAEFHGIYQALMKALANANKRIEADYQKLNADLQASKKETTTDGHR